ncbi:MAG: hydrogenase maturation protease [Chloroflexi bacterium AL-W]|nr:hydrogenase maturation protease [Chloroflexi bacterium AL-W]
MSIEIELTEQGYLHISATLAQQYFPQDMLVALVRGPELWLMPTRGAAAGGLLLKQRNMQGDRSVLIWEVVPDVPPGKRMAFWDDQNGALRVALASEAPT